VHGLETQCNYIDATEISITFWRTWYTHGVSAIDCGRGYTIEDGGVRALVKICKGCYLQRIERND